MLVGRTGLSPTMVGRSAPLARLTGLLTSASQTSPSGDGRPAVALVAGEAGIGKTRLLREVITALPAETVVLAGQAEPGSLGRPYELVLSMLGSMPALDGDHLRAVTDDMAIRIGRDSALVVFEDLHWADAESVSVFERLAGLALPTVLLVGTYRPDEMTRRVPAAEALVRLERRQQIHQLHLDRLRRSEVAAFLSAVYGRQLSSTVADTLFNRTGGNPFFLEELLVAAGEGDPDFLCAQPLPWSLSELVQRNLDGLSGEERRVVEAAAVLGRRAPFDVLAAMTGCTEDVLIGHLRALVERGLLLEEDDDEFSFRHALVRDAVEGQLLGRERRRLHSLALATLKQQSCADLAQQAHHAAGAGQYDELVELAREGVMHYLGRGSSHQALLLALEALPEAPDDPVLLEAAARAAWLVGQHEEALPHASRWRSLAHASGDVAAESAASRLLSRLYHEVEQEDDLWALVAEIEALTAVLPPGEDRAKNQACIAQIHMLNEHPEDAVRWAELAIAEAELADAKSVRAQAMVERGSALADLPDRFEEGEYALRQGIEEAEAVGDWVLVARGLNNLVKYVPTDVAENDELVVRLREAADRAGFDVLAAYAEIRAARYAIATGDLALARRFLSDASDRRPPDRRLKAAWLDNLTAFLLLEQGRFDEANQILRAEVIDHDGEMVTWRMGLRLVRDGLLGQRAGPDLDSWLATTGAYSYSLESLEALLDDLEAAQRLGVGRDQLEATIVRRWAEKAERPAEHHVVVGAVLAAGEGEHERVVDGLEPLLDRAVMGELHLPAYRRAELHALFARSAAALGRHDEARDAARAGRALLDQWPGWRRDLMDELVARLDGVPVEDGDPGAGLSPREREVAALLAEGVSNAELARRLYISPKTAAVHVSNILAKLGMASRAEVAAWAVRTGLASESPGA